MSTEETTPEWFQMAQADGYAPKPKKNRVLRAAALASPLFVLGAGLVFAQTQDTPTAVASASTTVAAADPATNSATAPISLASSTPAPVAASNAIQVSQVTPPTTRASITIKKPAITMPTGGGEDDGIGGSDDNGLRTSDDD